MRLLNVTLFGLCKMVSNIAEVYREFARLCFSPFVHIYVSEELVENIIIIYNVEFINLASINHLRKTQDKMVIL